jgi:mRNA interferase RelE/StbE
MKVKFRESFLDDLKRIRDQAVLRRVARAVEALEQAQSLVEVPHINKLKGEGSYFRFRIADYRLGFSVVDGTVWLVRVLDRKEIYRYFP